MPVSNTAKSDLLLVVTTLLAGVSWMISKEAILQMPPLLFIGMRFLLAGSLLAFAGRRQLRLMNAAQYRRAAGVGLVFAVAMSFWVTGLHQGTPMGEAAFITSLAVVLVPVVARLLFGEAQPGSTWLALPIAATGLAFLSLEHGFHPQPGQLFFVAAAVIFAVYYNLNTRAANSATVTGRDGRVREREKVPALALTAVALLSVGGFGSLLSLLLEPWRQALAGFSLELAGWVLASALIGTASRFFVQTYAQSLSIHSHGVVIMVLEPVWVTLFAALWFGETMSHWQMAGCALIFTALLVNRWNALRRLLRATLS